MRNEIRKELLTYCTGEDEYDNKEALAVVDFLEQLSADDLEMLALMNIYKDGNIPYAYVQEKGISTVLKTTISLKLINTLHRFDEVSRWLVTYLAEQKVISPIRFDTMPIDKFLPFAAIYNKKVYNDINALMSYGDIHEHKRFITRKYDGINNYKHMAAADLDKAVDALNENGIVLEVQKKNRALFHNIIYMRPEVSIECDAILMDLTKSHSNWFERSVVVNKAANYQQLKTDYPFEIAAFEEIIAGERQYFVRTEEPDYKTPFLRPYNFTETIYCHLSEKGEKMHAALKKEMGQTLELLYRPEKYNPCKSEIEEMRHAHYYSKELEDLDGNKVEVTADTAYIVSRLPHCTTVRLQTVFVRPVGWTTGTEVHFAEMDVDIDAMPAEILKRLNCHIIKLQGTIEPAMTNDGLKMVLHAHTITLSI